MGKYKDQNDLKRNLAKRNKRIQLLLDCGRITTPEDIPEDAIPADPRKTPAGGYEVIPYYQDIHFICKDCGSTECWTADSQMKYFEDEGANIYSQPVRCYSCRQKERMRKEEARKKSGYC